MLEEYQINVRIKLSLLWTSVMFCYVYGDYFELYVPGKVEDLLNGNNILDDPSKLLMASIVLAIPAFMIALSSILPASISRWLNIVLGSLYTAMMLFIGFSSITPWYGFYVLLAFLESVLTASIVWYAWRWPGTTSE